ncbi:MAG TPA: hypothetical protein VKZ91_10560 [Woeseiaceae bacterium]|nr:hypothetical protein [Woeseiaceae bacterium]
MTKDPKEITAARAEKREDTQHQFREAVALEQIADTLESMRLEFIDFRKTVMRALESQER